MIWYFINAPWYFSCQADTNNLDVQTHDDSSFSKVKIFPHFISLCIENLGD